MEHERQAHFKRDGGKLIGLSDESIRKHIRAGRLAAERVGVSGLYRIELADVKALAARLTTRWTRSWRGSWSSRGADGRRGILSLYTRQNICARL